MRRQGSGGGGSMLRSRRRAVAREVERDVGGGDSCGSLGGGRVVRELMKAMEK